MKIKFASLARSFAPPSAPLPTKAQTRKGVPKLGLGGVSEYAAHKNLQSGSRWLHAGPSQPHRERMRGGRGDP